jgi:hypothetical protein
MYQAFGLEVKLALDCGVAWVQATSCLMGSRGGGVMESGLTRDDFSRIIDH